MGWFGSKHGNSPSGDSLLPREEGEVGKNFLNPEINEFFSLPLIEFIREVANLSTDDLENLINIELALRKSSGKTATRKGLYTDFAEKLERSKKGVMGNRKTLEARYQLNIAQISANFETLLLYLKEQIAVL
ncbi:MAG TPA: hypothetical protein VJH75_04260 [Patescibacteria group bacterium]|nr:hypothetical protein [Patescibacteria group bacterium]